MKQKYIRHVQNAFQIGDLRSICSMPFSGFTKYGMLTGKDEKDQYYFKDNGSNILAVAHLDSVCNAKFCQILYHPQGWRIYSPALDDRLGAYVILHMLPTLGIKCDILLTNNEESGNTTAQHFITKKKYNWMFSFDRMGDDVVMYCYGDEEYRKILEKSEFTYGSGSFSCIAKLQHLGCRGFNFGVGYQDYHSQYAYAKFEDTISQVAKFTQFFKKYKDTHFSYKPTKADFRDRYVDDSYEYGYYRHGHYQGRSLLQSKQEWNIKGGYNNQLDMWMRGFYWDEKKHTWMFDKILAAVQKAEDDEATVALTKLGSGDIYSEEVYCRSCNTKMDWDTYVENITCPVCHRELEVRS